MYVSAGQPQRHNIEFPEVRWVFLKEVCWTDETAERRFPIVAHLKHELWNVHSLGKEETAKTDQDDVVNRVNVRAGVTAHERFILVYKSGVVLLFFCPFMSELCGKSVFPLCLETRQDNVSVSFTRQTQTMWANSELYTTRHNLLPDARQFLHMHNSNDNSQWSITALELKWDCSGGKSVFLWLTSNYQPAH